MSYTLAEPPEIFRGEPFVDRKSKFQAYCAVCNNIQDVCLFRDTLLDEPKIEAATHNILAWVTPEDSGFDDDGEARAGIQVLQMLTTSGAQNVAVMVSRWFGGIMLHGDRFRHITGAAMKVLRDNNLIPDKSAKKSPKNEESPQPKNKKRRRKKSK
jgi:putative IMPACT (imprinted ancient) family translation regulator